MSVVSCLPQHVKDEWVRNGSLLSMWRQDTDCPHAEIWSCCFPLLRHLDTGLLVCFLSVTPIIFSFHGSAGSDDSWNICDMWQLFTVTPSSSQFVSHSRVASHCLSLCLQPPSHLIVWCSFSRRLFREDSGLVNLPNHVCQLLIIKIQSWRDGSTIKMLTLDVRVIWLLHLSPHWFPGLIWLIWLARRVSPSFLTAPCVSLPKLLGRWGQPSLNRGGPVFGQGYISSCTPLLEPPNKLSKILITQAIEQSPTTRTHTKEAVHGGVSQSQSQHGEVETDPWDTGQAA